MKKLSVLVAVLLVSGSWCVAQTAQSVPRPILDSIVDDEPNPLPRYRTAAELGLPLPTAALPFGALAPPQGLVDTPAEFEDNQGILLRWGAWNSVVTELAVGITTGDPEAIVYMLVNGASQQASCTGTLQMAGADLTQVEFIVYTTNSIWIRDYGPRFIYENSLRAIVDHTYNQPRPLDNAFPDHLSILWSEQQYQIPLVHGGGNFHLFANGEAFMSSLITADNGLTEQQVRDYYLAYQNLDVTIYPGFPTSFDATRHIDMWMFPVDDYKIIIGSYALNTGLPHTITEDAVTDLVSRGYTVYRTPGWNNGGTHYTYTNAVVLNDLVFVPTYDGYVTQNAQAMAVFQTAFPAHQVLPVNCTSIIPAAGAIHCIVMHVPTYPSDFRVTPGDRWVAQGPVGGPFAPVSRTYTLENSSNIPLAYDVSCPDSWVAVLNPTGTIPQNGTVSVTVQLNATANVLAASIYETALAFTNLTNGEGNTTRTIELRVGDPVPVHTFSLDSDPGWSRTGQWQYGTPAGLGGLPYGAPDPTSGATGTHVFGVNLNGNYSTAIVPMRYLTTGVIDCGNLTQVELRFQRWLNTDFQPYVRTTVEATSNGTDWTVLWQNGATEIVDTSWSLHTFDLSSIADGQSSVQFRWGYEVQQYAYAYSGWNLDDVAIWGVDSGQCVQQFRRGDCNEDGSVNIADAIDNLNYLFGINAAVPGCLDAADANDDGHVDVSDAVTLLSALFGGGTVLPPPDACGPDPTNDFLGCDSYTPCCP